MPAIAPRTSSILRGREIDRVMTVFRGKWIFDEAQFQRLGLWPLQPAEQLHLTLPKTY